MQEYWSVFLYDFNAFCLALAGLGILVIVGEGLHRWLGVRPAVTRKIVHIGTGCFVAGFPLLFEYSVAVYVLAVVFILINGISLIGGALPGIHPVERRSWGTVSFPLALFIVLPFAWTADRVYALQTAFLILALSDPIASWIGQGTQTIHGRSIGTTGKTWRGSIAFFTSALVVTLAAALLLGGWPQGLLSDDTLLAVAVVVPLVGTAVELLGGGGWDNLFLGLGLTALLVVWGEHPSWTMEIVLSVLAGCAFAVAAIRLNYLTTSGAVAGGLFAATLLALGGWHWAMPGLVFFFSSSVLTKLRAQLVGDIQRTLRTTRRTATQVYANGGVAWVMVVVYGLYPDPLFYWAFLGSIAAAAADTWSSELGPLLARKPRLIISGRRVPPGTSGAVSLAGTAVGLLGAALVWAAAYLAAAEIELINNSAAALGIVVAGGAVGSLADSFVGATLQAVYEDTGTGELVEEPTFAESRPLHVRGASWMTNDRVNWICTTAGAMSASGFWLLL